MKPLARPVYLDLLRIRLPLPGWISILHRISGALLFLALPVAAWLLSVSLSGEAGFQRAVAWVSHPLVKLAILGLVWAFAHHFFAGVRHFALDVHWGVDLPSARRSSIGVLVATALATSLVAWRLWA